VVDEDRVQGAVFHTERDAPKSIDEELFDVISGFNALGKKSGICIPKKDPNSWRKVWEKLTNQGEIR
jgi:hypothetical protein